MPYGTLSQALANRTYQPGLRPRVNPYAGEQDVSAPAVTTTRPGYDPADAGRGLVPPPGTQWYGEVPQGPPRTDIVPPDNSGAGGGGGGGGSGGGGGTNLKQFLRAQQPSLDEAYNTLYNLLLSHGATDPRLMQRSIRGVDQGTQASQQMLEGFFAKRGFSGAGLLPALLTATEQGGTSKIADLYAEDAAKQEERKRQDLLLMFQLIIEPRLKIRGQNKALQAAQAGGKKGGGFDWAGLLGNLLKAYGNSQGGDTTDPGNYANSPSNDTYAGAPTGNTY